MVRARTKRVGHGRASHRAMVEGVEPRLFLSATPAIGPRLPRPAHVLNGSALHGSTRHVLPKAAPAVTKAVAITSHDIFPPADDGGDSGDIQPYNAIAHNTRTDLVGSLTPAVTPIGGAWTFAGPGPINPGSDAVSGRITGIAASPTDSNTIYISAAGGGVWKTTNGGTNWTNLTDAQATTVTGSIALSASNPNVIYAGTGEDNNSGDSQYGRGILKSSDGGNTWSLLGNANFNGRTIGQLVVDPTNENTVYAAVSDDAVNGNYGNTGIWKTTDGGTTWTDTTASAAPVGTGDTGDAFSGLAMDPTNPQILYSAIGSIFNSSANGLWKTINGGSTWTQLSGFTSGLANVGRISLTVSNTGAAQGVGTPILYGSIQSTSTSGVLAVEKSTDGGATFSTITPGTNYMGGQGWYDQAIAVSPTNPLNVFVSGSAGGGSIQESIDGGTTWSAISQGSHAPHADHHAAFFDASGRFLDGNDGGIWRLNSTNPSLPSWSDLNGNLAITQFQGVAIGANSPNVLFGGSQDNGTETTGSGSTAWNEVEGGDGGFVAISPNNASRIYHIAPVGSFGISDYFRRSDNGGSSWNSRTAGLASSGSANFYPPFVVDSGYSNGGADRLLLGTSQVNESTNNGDSWTPLSTTSANGWTTTSGINTIAVLPSTGSTVSNVIYASAGGHTFVTTNHGGTWVERDVSGGRGVSEIVMDTTDSTGGSAFAVIDGFNGSRVFHTTNFGVTWSNITGNLPDSPGHTIAFDPTASAGPTIFVGTDTGVFGCSTYGTPAQAKWNSIGSGLPNTPVYDLRLNQKHALVAGTHGRAAWTILTTTPLTLTGNNIYLKAGANGVSVDAWVDSATPGVGAPTQEVLFSTVSNIVVNGAPGDDVLTLDYSAGNLAGNLGGIAFNGSANGNNQIAFVGTPTHDGLSVTASSITPSGGLGAVPILVSKVRGISFPGGSGGNDSLNILGSPAGGYAVNADTASGPPSIAVGVINAGTAISFSTTQHLALLSIGNGASTVFTAGPTSGSKLIVTNLFSVSGTGKFDLTNNAMIVNYTSSSPLQYIAADIKSAYSGGAWSGAGITSSLADATGYAIGYGEASTLGAAGGTFLGEAVGPSAVLIRYTRYGDANLDGQVTFADFVSLSNNFGANTANGWDVGDFNYDGAENFSDFILLSNNFGTTA